MLQVIAVVAVKAVLAVDSKVKIKLQVVAIPAEEVSTFI